MKILALLSLVFCVQSAVASGTGEPILRKSVSAGARPPQYRHSRTVEVFPMGDVQVTVVDGLKVKTVRKDALEVEAIKAVRACSAKVKKVKEVKSPTCAGSGGTRYFVGSKMVSVKTCGEVHTMNLTCVKSMMELLDNL